MELHVVYICLCCLHRISFIRALTASDIEIIKQVSILCRSTKEKLRDAINSQFYIFLQSWLSFAAVLCRAPCFEGPILIFCLLLPATVCSLMFKAIASSICFTPTIGMLVPVFWILLCCVIIAKWPSLYFRHVWKVQEMCVATSRHFQVKTANGEGISLTILLPNGQRVRLQVHHSATIGNILQILHEYSDGYHISDTVLCLHDAGRTLAARPLQEAHMPLSFFFCLLQRATSKRVFQHLEEKQKPWLANVAANVVGVPQKSTPIKRYSARTAAASALMALFTSRPWLLAHIACVTRNCVCMDHAVSFVRRALPLWSCSRHNSCFVIQLSIKLSIRRFKTWSGQPALCLVVSLSTRSSTMRILYGCC